MPGSYRYECNDEFQGDRCDEDVDECLSSTCKHGEYCINSLERYMVTVVMVTLVWTVKMLVHQD